MVHFITFKNSESSFSFDRIKFECEEICIFDSVQCYTEKDVDDEYVNKYGWHFEKYKRGYGYWSWKPYFIKKRLSEVNEGDVVVYADCGCMILPSNRKTLEEWVEKTKNSDSGVLSPCYGPYIEHDWTRGDLYEYINSTYNNDNVDIFDKAVQCGAGVLVVCKKEKSVEFIDAWNNVMSEHFNLCTDEPSNRPNHPNFRENRHDQSAFSMLSKIYGIETIETKKGILDKDNSPIIAARCRNDKDTWKRPTRILFDSQTYDIQKFGGISRMYIDIHNELNKNGIIDNFTGNGVATGRYQDTYAKFSVVKTNNQYLKNIKPYEEGSYDNRSYSIKLLKEGNFDWFYPTFFDPYFLDYLNGKPFVMSVHDMIPELYPQFFPRNDYQIVNKRELVKYASAIEVPSETTKKDLIRILGVDDSKIHVIGRGLTHGFGNTVYRKPLVQSKYILYVGQRNLYKRFGWFLKHLKPYMDRHMDVNLVCTGTGFTPQETMLVSSLGLQGRVFHGFFDDIQLATLYRDAECFVYPSEYEGFGIPILESYKMNCPTLLNDTECFREVTFGQGEYFTLKQNESNLSERLEEITSQPREGFMSIRAELLNTYTWKNCVDKLKKCFV